MIHWPALKKISLQKETVITVLFVVVVVGIGIWLSWGLFSMKQEEPRGPVPVSLPKSLFPRTPPAGYSEYQNATYHVSFFYPNTFSVTEKKQKGTAITINFTHASDVKQNFQLFIMPYSDKEITPARLKTDIPSGIVKDPRDISVNDAAGVMFSSTDATLGGTVEAWFIHHGFLFEFTARQTQSAFLQSVLDSWYFFPEEKNGVPIQ